MFSKFNRHIFILPLRSVLRLPKSEQKTPMLYATLSDALSFIVGISGYFHDSSVCLLKDAKVVEFIKEESLTRVKGSKGFPCRALLLIKDKYNLSDDNVDHVVFYEKPFRGWASRIFRSLSMPKRAFKLLNNQLKQFWNGPISVAKEIRSVIPIAENKLLYAPHHLSHVLSALCSKKFRK